MTYVLTADIDWASEYCIARFLDLARRFHIVPTLFVTHESAAIRLARDAGRAELGIHPNFLPGSTHGDTIPQVVDHVLRLVPNPVAARCHGYSDSTAIATHLVTRGIRVDSNLCLHLQPDLAPLRHWAGLMRLPVFFEDDVHGLRGGSWRFDEHRAAFFTAGLKILNFHPFYLALNLRDHKDYLQHKAHITTLSGERASTRRNPGWGAETFLVDVIEHLLAAGHVFVPLSAVARHACLGSVRS